MVNQNHASHLNPKSSRTVRSNDMIMKKALLIMKHLPRRTGSGNSEGIINHAADLMKKKES